MCGAGVDMWCIGYFLVMHACCPFMLQLWCNVGESLWVLDLMECVVAGVAWYGCSGGANKHAFGFVVDLWHNNNTQDRCDVHSAVHSLFVSGGDVAVVVRSVSSLSTQARYNATCCFMHATEGVSTIPAGLLQASVLLK
jgi:hypothetical protein